MSRTLRLDRNIARPDDLYDRLAAMLDGLDAAEREIRMNKLILLLANHVGDQDVLYEAIARARAPRVAKVKD
ncbi:DUF2783 domain-containing protein [Sphingopyxis terrae]|uniref:DUF2783 domain-containing protein n=1 Tax=Sphingopyxis terrae TaxID=33052 RepID=UPI002A11FC12|nr:DUF2783 domain-containing protein [Sphingopyxis terrae]MDX8356494.1 DUF2783 domain-containing protein [Sphingopyxis terrae]